jgi:hypothetical protein
MIRWLANLLPSRRAGPALAQDSSGDTHSPTAPQVSPDDHHFEPTRQRTVDPFEDPSVPTVGWIRGGVSSRGGDWR